MELLLGVIDMPYTVAPGEKNRGVTTGDVAGWLENKYHVMEIFFRQNEELIAAEFAEAMIGELENRALGGPVGNAYANVGTQIEHRFRTFLDSDTMAGLGYPGVPTAAALKGVNHRLKIKKGQPRPSFIDTGLYETSFKAWVPD